ncbi:MAG: hypothetical protein D3924_20140 [Candidatus Electrothrix sp. AR4]|nr:hypothetical protein [Candidatus Electrothrix sp. AR4]
MDRVGPVWNYSFTLEPGNYYVNVTEPGGSSPFAWWATPKSAKNRSGAQKIAVTVGQSEFGKDFWLDDLQAAPMMSPVYFLLLD